MPENDEVHQVAKTMAKGAEKVVEPTHQDLLNAARAFTAAKRLLKDQGCNAITTDCLGMLKSKLVPTPPCLAASMFQDAGVTYGCEADIWGALSLMLPSYLFDKPGFMSNPVPETVRNHHIATHCVSATRLRGFKEAKERYILRSHAESNIGVSTQVIWSEGQPVTMIRFQDAKRLLLYTGTVIRNLDTPPTGGCRTSIELVLDRIDDVREVQGHHQVVFYGNHRREIEAFCQMYSIDLINKSRDGHSAL